MLAVPSVSYCLEIVILRSKIESGFFCFNIEARFIKVRCNEQGIVRAPFRRSVSLYSLNLNFLLEGVFLKDVTDIPAKRREQLVYKICPKLHLAIGRVGIRGAMLLEILRQRANAFKAFLKRDHAAPLLAYSYAESRRGEERMGKLFRRTVRKRSSTASGLVAPDAQIIPKCVNASRIAPRR